MLIGEMGNFHVMRVFKLAVSGEVVNNLNLFYGFEPWLHLRLHGHLGSVGTGISFSGSPGSNLHILLYQLERKSTSALYFYQEEI